MENTRSLKAAILFFVFIISSYKVLAEQLPPDNTFDGGRSQRSLSFTQLEMGMADSPLLKENTRVLTTNSGKKAVGVLLPLSGKREPVGQMILTGIQYASRVFTSNTTPNVEYIICDYGENEQSIPGIIEQLDSKEHVIALIGPLGETAGNLACREAQKRGIPTIMFSRVEALTNQDSFCFSNLVSADIQVEALLRTATDMNIKRFAVLSPADNFGKTFSLSFIRKSKSFGIEIVRQIEYSPDTKDMKGTVLKLIKSIRKPGGKKSQNAPADGPPIQALLIPDTATNAAMIASYMEYYKMKGVRLFGPNLWDTDAQKLIKIGGTGVENAVFASGFYANSQAENIRDFNDGFQSTFSYKPSIWEASAYDSATILQNFAGISAFSRPALQKELGSLQDFQGLTGNTTFSRNGALSKTLYVLTIKNSEVIEILP